MASALDDHDHVFLERLHLAVSVILELGEDDALLNSALETDLVLLKDKVERALLAKGREFERGRAAEARMA